ncbi:hypothetical protein GCM10010300_81210 [Streptomyces olivaceoviridis]|uniref:hypothetical protein n=1 Tax=Streptomyces olivaceoviridis TaxID=1921 RepID=UPI0019836DD4|nr:hypothetical protein [Streptomyces olivaceoviridis]GGZ25583.1 hypothetical protein GCM10010300_81210 [Streptomyces olivaceoviridis]
MHTTWDPATARLNSRMSTRYKGGHVEPFHSSSRLYTPEDLRTAFAEAGFTVHGMFGAVIGTILVICANKIAHRLGHEGVYRGADR